MGKYIVKFRGVAIPPEQYKLILTLERGIIMNEWGFNATKEPIAGLLKVIQDFKNPNINSKNYYPSVYWKYLEMLYYLYLPENRHLSDITMDDTKAYRCWKGMEDFPEYMFSLLPSRPIKMKRDFPDAFEDAYDSVDDIEFFRRYKNGKDKR